MQLPPPTRHLTRAFSLIEMLVVIAVIGIIAGIAVQSVSNINDSASMARDQRNAQNLCAMFGGAKAGGVAFASNTKEGIFDELVTGVTSPTNGIDFKFSPLDEEAKTAALAHCEYDPTADVMKFNGEAVAAAVPDPDPDPAPAPDPDPAPPADPVYGPWTNFQVVYNSQLVGRLEELRAQMPEREWRWIPTDPYIHNQSQIQYRTVD